MVSSLMFFNGQFIFTTILQVLSVLFSLFFVSLIPLPYLYIITEQSCLFSLFFLQIIPKIKSSSLLMSRSFCSPCLDLSHKKLHCKWIGRFDLVGFWMFVTSTLIGFDVLIGAFHRVFIPSIKWIPALTLVLLALLLFFKILFLSPRIRSDYNRNWPCNVSWSHLRQHWSCGSYC